MTPQEIVAARLIEALLMPYSDEAPHTSFQYPQTQEDKKAVALRVKTILQSEAGFLCADIMGKLRRTGKTLIEIAKSTQNPDAEAVIAEHTELLEKVHGMAKTCADKFVAKKKTQEAYEESFSAELTQLAATLMSNLEEDLIKTRDAMGAVVKQYCAEVADKSEKSLNKIKEKYIKIFEVSLSPDVDSTMFFHHGLTHCLKDKTYRLIDLYPSVLQYEYLIKVRRDAIHKHLKTLPQPIKAATEAALKANITHKIIRKFRKILEKYDPQYCATYKEYFARTQGFGDITPAKLYNEGHATFRQMNEQYHKYLYEFIETQAKLLDANYQRIFGFKIKISDIVEQLVFVTKRFLSNRALPTLMHKPLGFSLLLNQACDYATKMFEAFNDIGKTVQHLWIQKDKIVSPQILMAQVTSSFMSQIKSHEEVAAQDRKTQKMLEGKTREEAARVRAIEEKQMAEEHARKLIVAQKSRELKTEQESILSALPSLNKTQLNNLGKILRFGRGLHDLLETEAFCDVARKLPPFSIENSDKGYGLFYNKKFMITLHREHGGKKLNGEVLAIFVGKLTELRLVPEMLRQMDGLNQVNTPLLNASKKKAASGAKAANPVAANAVAPGTAAASVIVSSTTGPALAKAVATTSATAAAKH